MFLKDRLHISIVNTAIWYFPTGTRSCSPVNECDFYNGECTQVCVDTDDSYYCGCHEGYKLAPNDYNCPGQSCQLPVEQRWYFVALRGTCRCPCYKPSELYNEMKVSFNPWVETKGWLGVERMHGMTTSTIVEGGI